VLFGWRKKHPKNILRFCDILMSWGRFFQSLKNPLKFLRGGERLCKNRFFSFFSGGWSVFSLFFKLFQFPVLFFENFRFEKSLYWPFFYIFFQKKSFRKELKNPMKKPLKKTFEKNLKTPV